MKKIFKVLTLMALTTGTAHAQSRTMQSFEMGDSKGYKSTIVTLPVIPIDARYTARIEYNLDSKASLGLEGTLIARHDRMDASDHKEAPKDSMLAQGWAAGLQVSRFSRPADMSGFFWTLGTGYQQMNIGWTRTVDTENLAAASLTENENNLRLSRINSDGAIYHEMKLAGAYGTGRLGYRYVGEEWPFTIGAHLGARHFAAKVTDDEMRDQDDNVDNDRDSAFGVKQQSAPLSIGERESMRRRFTTAMDLGVEVGFRF